MDSRFIHVGKLPKEALRALVKKLREGHVLCSIRVGARVEKINSEPSDKHKDGDQGVVMGSDYRDMTEWYFVIFDDMLEGKTWTPDMLLFSDDDGEDEDFFPILIHRKKLKQL